MLQFKNPKSPSNSYADNENNSYQDWRNNIRNEL